LSVGAIASLAVAAPALAVPSEPPVLPHSIISFPQRDFVSAAGFAQGNNVTVNVIRNGVTIGTSTVIAAQDDTTTPGFDGMVEVNHPGGGCWLNTTPDILPGDIVRTTVAGSGVQDQTHSANVTTQAPTNPSPGTIVVHGSAQTPTGARMPLAQIEQRFVSTGNLFQRNGRRTLRAGGAAGNIDGGTFAYDPGSTNWTARYTGLSAADVTEVMNSDPRALWLSDGSGAELTIYESAFTGGPTAPCNAPLASNAVTDTDHVFGGKPTWNKANSLTHLGLSGVAQANVRAVRILVTDSAGTATASASTTLSTGTGPKTWSGLIPRASVNALADGTLTASAIYTLPTGTITGTTLAIRKDMVAPAPVTATPAPGTFTTKPNVTLKETDTTAPIRYTTDGTVPDDADPVFGTPIAVTTSQTIKAIATDPAGNPSTVASFAYNLVPQAQLNPTTVNFANRLITPTASPATVVTLTNTGAATLNVSNVALTGANAGDFVIGTSTCSAAALAPAQKCTVQVRFKPTARGARTAALTFTDNAAGSPHSVALNGTGLASEVTFSPTSVAFGDQRTGTTSAEQQVTITNTGNSDLTINSLIRSGTDFNQFVVGAQTCVGVTIAPGATCTANVAFKPTSTGAKSGTLRTTDNAPGSPHTMVLTGTGTASAVSFDTPLNFGDQETGTTSASQTLTVTNSGTASLTVSSVTLAGTDPTEFSLVSETCTTAAIAPGATCQVTVAFKPTTAGAKSASVSLTDDAPGSPHTSALSGNGVDPVTPPAP
jgi:hypothetical protein